MSIGENIKYYRMKQNLTQKGLAKKVFVSEKTIGHWETGKRMPSIDTIQTLSKILEVTMEDMLEERENILLMYFSFLLEDEHYVEHTEEKKGYRVVLRDKTVLNAPKIYLDIVKDTNRVNGVWFHAEKQSRIGFSKENDIVYEIDAPEWYIDLFLKATDTYHQIYRERVEKPEKKHEMKLLTEFFLRHKKDDREMFLKSRLQYFETHGISVPDKELFEILKHMYIEEGYRFVVPKEEECCGYIVYPDEYQLKELSYLKDRMAEIINDQMIVKKR